MAPTPNAHEPPKRPDFDVEGAHKLLLGLTALVGVPLVVVVLVWKGLGAAFALGLIVVLVWLNVAGLIPQEWEVEEMRRKPGPIERIIVRVLAVILIVICVGFLVSPKNVGWHYVEDADSVGAGSRGVMTGSGPTTAERILDEMLRRK